MERRLAAILAADVAGYSHLMAVDEAGTLEHLKVLQSSFISPLIAEHQGRIVKLMGDGFLVEFASAINAVNCAVAWQKGVPEQQGEIDARFRIGVNLGDIVMENDDIFGNGVIIAARLESIATSGGICMSAAVHDQVRQKLEETFTDLGERQLRNIDEPVHVFAWSADGNVGLGALPPRSEAHSQQRVIAVLPFQNMSSDPDQEFFADGITEDIISTLSKISGLAVISRNSSFAYKGKAISVKDVSTALGARYVLEASVRRSGNRMRISAQLTDAADGANIWSERYDRSVEDVFDVQDDINRQISMALQTELVLGDYAHKWQDGTKNFAAWENRARGVHEYLKFTREGMINAKKCFEQAVALEPEDETSQAALGHCYDQMASAGWLSDPEEGFTAAQKLGERILASNPKNSDAHQLLASVHRSRGQFDEAIASARQGLELDQNDSSTHAFLASTLISADRANEALKPIETAIQLNPSWPNWVGKTRVDAYRVTGQLQRALDASRELVERYPDYLTGLVIHTVVCVELDMKTEEKQAAQAVLDRDPDFMISTYRAPVKLKNAKMFDTQTAALRKAGLPE